MQFSTDNKRKSGQATQQNHFPLFLKVSVIVLLLAGMLVGVEGLFCWRQQKDALFAEQIRSAERILDLLAASVKIPLLTDDALRLNSLVRDTIELEGIVDVTVFDRNRVVKVHSGEGDIEEIKRSLENGQGTGGKNDSGGPGYTDQPGGQPRNLFKVVMYHEKPLGTVHLAISSQFIDDHFDVAKETYLNSLLRNSLILIPPLLFISFFYSRRLKRRTNSLIQLADEYGNGNLQYRIEKIENNEWGDVVCALHSMSQGLLFKEPSQAQLDQYLKYSSLDRILEYPMSQDQSYAFRRQVAVLFASIKGFGTFAGTEHPEEIVKGLNKYIGIVTKVINKHGGYVDKVIGDAVVVIFGVSLYRENHTFRAIQAALDLQEALSAGSEHESQLLSNVCVGISSGIVLSGNIGTYSKVEYSSIGESIKEASWLSDLGHPGEIILGEEIYSLMKDDIDVQALPPQKILGGEHLIKCYRLQGLVEKQNGSA